MFGVTKEFFDAALPWVTIAVALALFSTCYNNAKQSTEKEKDINSEK